MTAEKLDKLNAMKADIDELEKWCKRIDLARGRFLPRAFKIRLSMRFMPTPGYEEYELTQDMLDIVHGALVCRLVALKKEFAVAEEG